MRRGFLTFSLLIGSLDAHAAMVEELRVKVAMRDGVRLSANVFRPQTAARVSTILLRTPYNKGDKITANLAAFVNHGFAIVVQDVRGRYASEGEFRLLDQEGPDGSDTLDWIARQPWSNGNVGMMGGSYLGIAQWRAALSGNKHLKAIFPSVSGGDEYYDRFFSPGGAFRLGHRLLWMADNLRAPGLDAVPFSSFIWHLPLRSADRTVTGRTWDFYQRAMAHPAYDAFWRQMSTLRQAEKIRIPVFLVGGWYDNYVESDLALYSELRRWSSLHRILIGPWPHNMSIPFTTVTYGPESRVGLQALELDWFEQWLNGKNGKILTRPPARIFVMGANQWRESRDWPLKTSALRLYLTSSRGAASLAGDGTLERRAPLNTPPDRFVYDPNKPVPTTGGSVCCDPKIFPWGPFDQRKVEQRRDVLVYTTAPLTKDVEVAGTIRVSLYVSTSARDTDFTAKLLDVTPEGAAMNLCDGILRLRYRDGLEKPALAKPGEIYRLTLNAGVTGNLFRRGHRIRLEISSSNFPRFDRNPNTGGEIASETELRTASQTIYHDREHPSHLELPVLKIR